MKPSRRRVVTTAALVVAVFICALIARHAIGGLLLQRGLSVAFGSDVAFDAYRLGRDGATFENVHVRRRGAAFFDAARVTLHYSLRDALPGGRRAFGLASLTLERPVITLVRFADGEWNVTAPVAGGASGTSAAPPHYAFDLHLHDGTLAIVDQAPIAPDLAVQRVTSIALDAHVDTLRRTVARLRGVLAARGSAAAPLAGWPLSARTLIDAPSGIGLTRVRAAALPLRSLVAPFVHARAFRVDAGIAHRVDLAFTGSDLTGRATVTGARCAIGALLAPVDDVGGTIALSGGGIWSQRLTGTVLGVPLVARGGVFDLANPTIRLGVSGAGDLAVLKQLFGFSRSQPVRGRTQLQTLIEAPLAGVLVRTAFAARDGAYGRVPVAAAGGIVDYHDGSVVLGGLHGRYGPARVAAGGRFVLGRGLDSAIVLQADAPGRRLPFAENIAPDAAVDGLALLTGTPAGYVARGSIGATGARVSGAGFFHVDERGRGEFGPFAFARTGGSELLGGLRLDRPSSASAVWLTSRGYRLAEPLQPAGLPGLRIPAFPPLAGAVDADLAGAGTPARFALTGVAHVRDLQAVHIALGDGRATLGGTLRDVRLANVRIDGPLGRFAGAGVADDGTFGLRGDYDGSLEALRPLTGEQRGAGRLRGPVVATFGPGSVVVQTTGARLDGGHLRGVAVDTAAGTLAISGGQLHVVAAQASIGGQPAVAVAAGDAVAVSAPALSAGSLAGTGLPLQAGTVGIFGRARLGRTAPSFDGSVTVAGGRAQGYAVAGDMGLKLSGARVEFEHGTAALGGTFGTIDGAVDGFGEPAVRYDLRAGIALGDVRGLAHDLHLPVPHLEGSFRAALRIRGAAARPQVDGTIAIPEGRFDGLAFRRASARVAFDRAGLAADDGQVTVGSTRAMLSAHVAGPRLGLAFASAALNLADFDDFFDESAFLAGTGRADVAYSTDGVRTSTRGSVALHDLRFRRFTLGDAVANWQTAAAGIRGRVRVAGTAGALAGSLTIRPAAGPPLQALRGAFFDGRASIARFDLGTWLPAAGYQGTPVLGLVDAAGSFAGRFPRIAVDGSAALSSGSIGGVPIAHASLRAHGDTQRLSIAQSDADLGFAHVSATGTVGFGERDPIALDFHLQSPELGRTAHTLYPPSRGLGLGGSLAADVRISGNRRRPQLNGDFDVADARYGTFTLPSATGELSANGNALVIRNTNVVFARGTAAVTGVVPLVLQPFGFGPPSAALAFTVSAHGVDLGQFAPLFPAGTLAGGTLDGSFGVTGSIGRPRLVGGLTLANGSYRSARERTPFEHVAAQLAFSGSTVALQTFHAELGAGSLDASGRLILPLGPGTKTRYDFDIRAQNARLDIPAFGSGTLNGALSVSGFGLHPAIAGDVALSDARIPFGTVVRPPLSAGGGAAGSKAPAAGLDPTFDIHAIAGKNVRIRNANIDIGATGSVDLTGTLTALRLAGAFTSTDGTFSTYNHAFRVQSASVTFDPESGLVPELELRAVAHVTDPDPDVTRNIAGSADITVTVHGPADAYAVTYTSNPPYSDDQIVALLLDLPAILGAVNFYTGPGGTLIRGAPGESNVLLPPGVSPDQIGVISFDQEIYSVLGGQLTQRALSPAERSAEQFLGLSDLGVTVDRGGGIGYEARRELGSKDLYAQISQTVTYPERVNIGLSQHPDANTSIDLDYFRQNGITSLITTTTPGRLDLESTGREVDFQPLGDRTGVQFTINRHTP